MSPALLGFIRAIGSVVVFAVVSYIADASHLSGLMSVSAAAVISGLALSLEHYLGDKSGTALFGAVKIQK